MMERPINKQTGQRIFNLDYGESSDEEYDGMRYSVLPMGVGWHAWNQTLFEQIVDKKTVAQKGVMSLEDLLPSTLDRTYSLPDPTNPGPSQPLVEAGIPMTPFGGDTEYHILANKHEPVERSVSMPGALPVRWRVGEEHQKHVDQRLHLDEYQTSAMLSRKGGREDLEQFLASARGNSSRPGTFDLKYASPVSGGKHATVMPVIEGGDRHNHVLSDIGGAVPVLDEQQYLRHLWQETRKQRVKRGSAAKYVALPGKPEDEYLDADMVAVSANHPPPLVRKGLTLKWDLATWVNSCMHAGGGWNGSALSLDHGKWPQHQDEATWQGDLPQSKRLRGESDSSSTDHDSGEGNIPEEAWDAVMPEGSSDPSDMQSEETKARKLAERQHREKINKDTTIISYLHQRTPATTPTGESETVLVTLREPTKNHPDYYKNQTLDEFLGTYKVNAQEWIPPSRSI